MASSTPLDLPPGLPERARTRAALEFADERHAGQRRGGDGAPFIMHPVEVGWLLHELGYPDHVVAAAVLHDVLEDTDTGLDELERRFGADVATLVASLSADPSIANVMERKAALREQVAKAGPDAAAVFAADKISRTRELHLGALRAPLGRDDRIRFDHYVKSLMLLDELLPCHPLVARLRRELSELASCVQAGR